VAVTSHVKTNIVALDNHMCLLVAYLYVITLSARHKQRADGLLGDPHLALQNVVPSVKISKHLKKIKNREYTLDCMSAKVLVAFSLAPARV
jgi:hypothetical protein